MMAKDLYQLADAVHDEQSFIEFVTALSADWEEEQELESKSPSSPYASGVLGWENGTIGAFLERAGSWAAASVNGLKFYEKPSNPWRRAAHILHAGKFYE
jgi:hypothetical protein